MFGIIKKIFIVFSTSLINTLNHIKCVSLSNQKCEFQPTLISLYPNEYSQELQHSSIQIVVISTFLPRGYFGLVGITTF